MQLRVNGELVTTTATEFRLLDYLARHPGRVFSRDHLLDAVWGDARFVTPRSVDVYVRRIREKIEADAEVPRYLKTMRGAGYRFEIPKDGTGLAKGQSVTRGLFFSFFVRMTIALAFVALMRVWFTPRGWILGAILVLAWAAINALPAYPAPFVRSIAPAADLDGRHRRDRPVGALTITSTATSMAWRRPSPSPQDMSNASSWTPPRAAASSKP